MAIHESLALWCYHPLIGKKRIGYYLNGGSWDDKYFDRNKSHWQAATEYVEGLIKSRFSDSRNLVFLQHWFRFDVDWQCFYFNYMLDSCASYPMNLSVTVWCPALLSPKAGADNFINNTTKR